MNANNFINFPLICRNIDLIGNTCKLEKPKQQPGAEGGNCIEPQAGQGRAMRTLGLCPPRGFLQWLQFLILDHCTYGVIHLLTNHWPTCGLVIEPLHRLPLLGTHHILGHHHYMGTLLFGIATTKMWVCYARIVLRFAYSADFNVTLRSCSFQHKECLAFPRISLPQ